MSVALVRVRFGVEQCLAPTVLQITSATFRLDGDTVNIVTNSETRHERVLTEIRELVPTAVLVSESRKPARDAREEAAPGS
jgi:hypothetical protein